MIPAADDALCAAVDTASMTADDMCASMERLSVASAPACENVVERVNGEVRNVLERQLVDLLNEGSATELQTLAGIGPKRALYIVEQRAESGPFTRIDELEGLGGLTAKHVEQLTSA